MKSLNQQPKIRDNARQFRKGNIKFNVMELLHTEQNLALELDIFCLNLIQSLGC